jgi:hypothetical protein
VAVEAQRLSLPHTLAPAPRLCGMQTRGGPAGSGDMVKRA